MDEYGKIQRRAVAGRRLAVAIDDGESEKRKREEYTFFNLASLFFSN